MEMFSDGIMNDTGCQNKMPSVCEIRKPIYQQGGYYVVSEKHRNM